MKINQEVVCMDIEDIITDQDMSRKTRIQIMLKYSFHFHMVGHQHTHIANSLLLVSF
jgi:hypothetical protein